MIMIRSLVFNKDFCPGTRVLALCVLQCATHSVSLTIKRREQNKTTFTFVLI